MTDNSVPSSPGFDEETRTYMQARLRLLSGSVTAITGVPAAAFLATLWQNGDDGPDPGRRPKNAATLRAQLLPCEAAGAWGTAQADAWWAGFEKPSILDETTSSTGSPSVFATALIGEATALLLDSEKLRELDKLPEP